ncbi:hypothetical protein BACPLE_01813 [Phocaeicola plebeius DSM 17135]|uniref:Uncharacterized protein n=1 Tax=Phocaeicola plebeius (strain DSM 17135 / JCM 12973 / CCUG 54634 / M2) TaxID=484018 RepID=B5CYL0_PHOPM|nr:hypothetical protein BACPLE_01813 [Phocaeicola plebeius DSM 17135]
MGPIQVSSVFAFKERLPIKTFIQQHQNHDFYFQVFIIHSLHISE